MNAGFVFLLVLGLVLGSALVAIQGHPHDCDCSPDYEACLNLTEAGSEGFRLFGKTMTFFDSSIESVLLAFDEDEYSKYNYAAFYLYFLKKADYGDVACMYTSDSAQLDDFQDHVRNSPALSSEFQNFTATEAFAFAYFDIETTAQDAASFNNTAFFDAVNEDLSEPIGPEDIDTTPHNFRITLVTDGTYTFAIYNYFSLPTPPPAGLGTISWTGFGYTLPNHHFPQDVVVFPGSHIPPGVHPARLLNASNAGEDGVFVFRVDQLSCFQEEEYFCITDYAKNFSVVEVQVNEATFSFVEEYLEYIEVEYTIKCEGPTDSLLFRATSETEAPTEYVPIDDLPSLTANYTAEYSVRVSGLLGGTNYSCTLSKVFDNNEFGDISSPTIEITTLTDVPSAAPEDFTCQAISDTEIVTSWKEVPLSQRNGQVQYTLNLTSSDETVDRVFSEAPSTPTVIGGLEANTTYHCSVSAFTSAGSGPSSSQQTLTYLPVPVPSIQSVTGNCSIGELTIQWNSQENSGNSLQITNVSVSYNVISSDGVVSSVSNLVFPVNTSNTYTVDLSPAALLAPDIAFQAFLLSSTISGNTSEVFQFNCLPVTICDCSLGKETCLNLTDVGSGGFPLFGKSSNLFRANISSVLEAFDRNVFSGSPIAAFSPYFLDSAARGSVECTYVNSTDPLNILPGLVQDLQNAPTLARDFPTFSPTEAIVFTFREIQTDHQIAAKNNITAFFDDLNSRLNPTNPIGPSDIDTVHHSYDVAFITDGTNTFTTYRYLSLPSSPPQSVGTVSWSGFGYTLPNHHFPQDVVVFPGSNIPPGVHPARLLNASNAGEDGVFVFRVDQLSCFQEEEYFCITDNPRNFSLASIEVNEANFSFVEEYFDDVELEYTIVCEGPPGTTPCTASTQVETPIVYDLYSPVLPELPATYTAEYSVRVSGLLGGTNYSCTLSKVFDNSEFGDITSPPIAITTVTDVPSTAPENFTCEAISDTEIVTSWKEVPLSQRNGQVQYTLNLTTSDETVERLFSEAPSTPTVIGGLEANTTYHCSVSAFTSAGSGPSSSEQTLTYLSVPVPSILSTTGNCSIVELTVAWDSQENSGNSLQITNVSISYDVISSDGLVTSVSNLVFPLNASNTYTVDLSPAALLAPDIAFQAFLLSSAIRGNTSEVLEFNCLPVTICDCSLGKETCLNLTDVGSEGFPLFGRSSNLFRANISSVLEAFDRNVFSGSPTAAFSPYFLDSAARGSVECTYVNSTDPLNILPGLVQDLQNAPTLAGDFPTFSPTEAIVFTFRDIQTDYQIAVENNNTAFFDDLNSRLNPTNPIGPSDIDTVHHSYDVAFITDGTNTFTTYRYLSLPSSPPQSVGTVSWTGFGYTLPNHHFPQDVVVFPGSNIPPGVHPPRLLNASNAGEDGVFVFRVDQLSCFQEEEYFCITDNPRNFSLASIEVNEANFSFIEEYFDDVELEYIVVCEGPPGTTPCTASTQVETPIVYDLYSPVLPELPATYTAEYSVRVSGLLGGTSYSCTLSKVFDNSEFGDITSPPIVITTVTDEPETAALDFICQAISDTEIMASWSEVPLSQRNGQVQYVFSLTSFDQIDNIHRTTSQAPTTPLVIGGLRSNTMYFCVVGTTTAAGIGPHSSILEAVTFLPVPVPSIISVNGNCSIVEITIEWNTRTSGNSLPITDVSVKYDLILSNIVANSINNVISANADNVYAISLEAIASVIRNLRFQVNLLSSGTSGNLSSPVEFTCTVAQTGTQFGGSKSATSPSTLLLLVIAAVVGFLGLIM